MLLPPEHPKVRVPIELLPGPLADEIRALQQHPAGILAFRLYQEHRGVSVTE